MRKHCPLDPDLGRNPGASLALSAHPSVCSTNSPSPPFFFKFQSLNGAKTLMVPGHPVLVLVPQVTPELSLSLVRMALGRVGLSTALCRRASEPSLGPCPHRHSLLRLCCGHPWGFAPDQGTATPFFSPLILAQGKPVLDFSVVTYRLLCSSQVFRLRGLEAECSHRGGSQLPPLSLLS